MAMAYRGLVPTAHWLSRALRANEASSTVLLSRLRPAIQSSGVWRAAGRSRTSACQRRGNHSEALISNDVQQQQQQSSFSATAAESDAPKAPLRRLPLMCSGCGAFSQTDDPQQLGYFDVKSKRVRTWLHPVTPRSKPLNSKEDKIVAEAIKGIDQSKLKELGLNPADLLPEEADNASVSTSLHSLTKPPICDRCHNLIHHSTTSDTAKVAMYHPTVESLRETIEESPHKYNHIYHIIDAADFPMSLIPRLNLLIGDISLRSRNRRSRAGKYHKDRQAEMSFIITRSDLLAPTKEMVDNMMPYLREVLRDALGRVGERVRLGNVRCVSAKRSWWTKEVKEDIWKRGGAGWMVGKVNVGKSQLFEAVYPKGRMMDRKEAKVSMYPREALTAESVADHGVLTEEELSEMDFGELLPPPQPAQNYPEMPLVSSLPGTTASPIRIPFGSGRGELIDLPGLARSDLELFVREEHRQSLIMQKRIIPEQVSVKPGKSLILGGGLIRITPKTPNMVFLMYNFTPLEEHLTMTEKAVAFQNQTRTSVDLTNITLPDMAEKMEHAGTFRLQYDVTKKRAGPLTRKNAIGLQVDRLPFRVLSVDILVEGVGYVEIVAQVRARDFECFPQLEPEPLFDAPKPHDKKPVPIHEDPFLAKFSERRDDFGQAATQKVERVEADPVVDWPAVDIYTPEGRFIGTRQPLSGWLNNKPRVLPEHKRSRPRRSMKGQKKKEKLLSRSREVAAAAAAAAASSSS